MKLIPDNTIYCDDCDYYIIFKKYKFCLYKFKLLKNNHKICKIGKISKII